MASETQPSVIDVGAGGAGLGWVGTWGDVRYDCHIFVSSTKMPVRVVVAQARADGQSYAWAEALDDGTTPGVLRVLAMATRRFPRVEPQVLADDVVWLLGCGAFSVVDGVITDRSYRDATRRDASGGTLWRIGSWTRPQNRRGTP